MATSGYTGNSTTSVDATVAEGLSTGAFELGEIEKGTELRKGSAPEAHAVPQGLLDRIRKSRKAREAVAVFHRAFARMRQLADEAAWAEVAQDLADVKAVDDAIVEMACELPHAQRSRIAGLRKKLVGRIAALGKRRGRRDRVNEDQR